EFCAKCGSGTLEYGANAGDYIYIMHGTLDNPAALPPPPQQGEFRWSERESWTPQVPGTVHGNS
ncbi:hypothetical protein OIDMADRAFT_116913, partial [Oidiodendron maius Zn]